MLATISPRFCPNTTPVGGAYFAHWLGQNLYRTDGKYDLYYFDSPQKAAEFATDKPRAAVLETSRGQIWRVAIRVA